RAVGAGAPCQALLPARPEGQGRSHEGNQAGLGPIRIRRRSMVKVRATRSLENALRRWGFHLVAGCDEVGRGCLAGPVMAGAVILDPGRHIPGLFDSKMTTLLERERLYDVITRRALAWAVASSSPSEI